MSQQRDPIRLQERVWALEAEVAHLKALLGAVPIAEQSVFTVASHLLQVQADTLDWANAQLLGPARLDQTLQLLQRKSAELRHASHTVLYHPTRRTQDAH